MTAILEFVRGKYNSLNPMEKRVANYILERPDDVIHYSITEFAEQCGTSETTIYRLCRKLGFNGYQDFKISLAREIGFPKREILKKGGSFEEFVKEIFKENLDLIEGTMELVETDKIKRAVDMILESRRILFFGVGRSSIIARDGSIRFALLGFPSSDYSDPHVQVMVGAGLTKDDLVIGISHSGVIKDIVKSMQVSHDAGAKTIAITSGINSPITKVVDLVLYCSAGKYMTGDLLTNRVGELVIMDILYKSTLFRLEDKLQSHLEDINRILEPKRS